MRPRRLRRSPIRYHHERLVPARAPRESPTGAAEVWCAEGARRYVVDVGEMSTAAAPELTTRFVAAPAAGGGQRPRRPSAHRPRQTSDLDRAVTGHARRQRAKQGSRQLPVTTRMATAHIDGTISRCTSSTAPSTTCSGTRHRSITSTWVVPSSWRFPEPPAADVGPGLPSRRAPPRHRHLRCGRQWPTVHHVCSGEPPETQGRTRHRCARPAELDPMAQLAGLHLVQRRPDQHPSGRLTERSGPRYRAAAATYLTQRLRTGHPARTAGQVGRRTALLHRVAAVRRPTCPAQGQLREETNREIARSIISEYRAPRS